MKNCGKAKNGRHVVLLAIVTIVVFAGVFWFVNELLATLEMRNVEMTLLVAGGVTAVMLLASRVKRKKHEFENIEQGSARWASAAELNPLADKEADNNLILSDCLRLSLTSRAVGINRHTLVLGGSGSGKSRFYVKPNVLQMNASYVITDPKGEHLRSEGTMLEQNGYKIKVFNIVDMDHSMRFNPFCYFHETQDLRRFINMLMANTTGESAGGQQNEDFWVKAERLWLMACISYIVEACTEAEKNMNSLITLLDNSQAKDDDEDFMSPVDVLFDDLEQKNPQSFAAKQYKKYKLAAGKTAKSILISIGVRLSDFDIQKMADLVFEDELELEKIGDEKTALFLIIDDMDTTYNYLVAILIDVMFNVLKRRADASPSGVLPIPVSCFLDELANIGRFKNLHIMVSVLRSRGIMLHLIFQTLSQVKAIYKENADILIGNCDTTIFLGGKGEETQKYVSNMMVGKATIDTTSTGGSGGSGSLGYNSYNYNDQKAGRNLLDETEVTRIGQDECIVAVKGFQPFLDKKYKPERHKNYRRLADSNPANAFVYNSALDFAKSKYITELNLEEVM